MADIFLSYASEDRARARPVAEALERSGWSVWWDRKIPAGKNFDEVIEAELGKCGCCIVLWSRSSVKSRWVKNEAGEAVERNILVPAMLEPDLALPLMFRRLQAADLTDWAGSPTPGFEALVEAVRNVLTVPANRRDSATNKPLADINATIPVTPRPAPGSRSAPSDGARFPCPRCSRLLPMGALFCSGCGTALDGTKEKKQRSSPESAKRAPEGSLPPGALEKRLRDALVATYRVERQMSRGSISTVFAAHDVKHDRSVALKVLRSEVGQGVRAGRFAREISIAARLHHPHILPLYDSGQSEGFLFYVMPLVEGESLRDRLKKDRRFPVETAVTIARDVAEALDYAHGQGVVHRDIRPENIMLHAGHGLISDFGVARAIAVADAGKLTATGFTVGVPAYMSPEQAAGNSAIDGRADIYSLGCVLFEMLTGKQPFGGTAPSEIFARHLNDPVPSVGDSVAALPEWVDRAIGKAMAKQPDDRFPTGGEFAAALSAGAAAEKAAPPGKKGWFR